MLSLSYVVLLLAISTIIIFFAKVAMTLCLMDLEPIEPVVETDRSRTSYSVGSGGYIIERLDAASTIDQTVDAVR